MLTTAGRAGTSRVLFLSGLQIHPTLSGGNLRSFALANALQRHGLDVFVYSLVGRKNDYLLRRPSSIQAWPEEIEEYVDRRLPGFVAQYASYGMSLPPVWITAYLRAAALSPGEWLLPALLREKLAWCDTVVADFPFVYPVFGTPSARGRLRVVNTHNIEHRLYDGHGRWPNRRIQTAVRRIELAAARACDILVSCCAGDAEFFAQNAPVRRSVLVPNGIDMRRFHGLEAHRARVRQELGIAEDVRVFLFTASKWGPNREAFDYLLEFARTRRQWLAEQRIHILVVGSVTSEIVRLPGFTATGKVSAVEPYFAAADAALNPLSSGTGTNLKTCEFIALRLPLVTTTVGARGFCIQDGRTGFIVERDGLAPVLSTVRRLFDEDPGRLRQMAAEAYAQNQGVIDMDACARSLVQAMDDARGQARSLGHAS